MVLMLGLGNGITETVAMAVLVQLFRLATRLYVSCFTGDTFTVALALKFGKAAVDHTKLLPLPMALKLTALPKHTKVGLGEIDTFGNGLTVMLVDCKAELQPKLPPYTENTELMLGLATATLPVV